MKFKHSAYSVVEQHSTRSGAFYEIGAQFEAIVSMQIFLLTTYKKVFISSV